MRAVTKIIHLAESNEKILSQSNPKNIDGNKWCGRTSASMIFNYYKLVEGRPDELIVNQSDRREFNLVHPDGSYAALLDGACATMEAIKLIKGPPWGYKPLYPGDVRGKGAVDVEATFGPLLDHLDANNPALFASGISRGRKYASHFVVISGYRFREGELWLHITDPAANNTILAEVIKATPGMSSEPRKYLEVIQDGAYAKPDSKDPTHGALYWVRASVLLLPNPYLANNRNLNPDQPRPVLLCDNQKPWGFAVLLSPGRVTEQTKYVDTELPVGWPIDVIEPKAKPAAANEKTTAAKSEDAEPKPKEPVDWTGWVDDSSPYPLGSSITWHGGVHLLATQAARRQVFCIGPGEIVLARFPPNDPKRENPSSGFVLVRHRLDVERRSLVDVKPAEEETVKAGEPAKVKPRPTEDFFSLYMHLAPIGTYLQEPTDGIRMLKPDAPYWLTSVAPVAPSPYREWIPASAERVLSVFKSEADATNVTWTPLPCAATATLGGERSYQKKDGQVLIGGHPAKELTVAGAKHLVMPEVDPSILGASRLAAFVPTIESKANLVYSNLLTGELIDTKTPAKGGRVRTLPNKPEVEVVEVDLGQPGKKKFVRLETWSEPATLVPREKGHLHDGLRALAKPVTVSLTVNNDTVTTTITPPAGRRLLVALGSTRILHLDTVAAVPTASLTRGTKGLDVSQTGFFNPLTETFHSVPDLKRLHLLPTGKSRGEVVFVEGPTSYIRLAAPAPVVTPASGDPGAIAGHPDYVLFYAHDVPRMDLYPDATKNEGGSLKKRKISIANSDAALVFACDKPQSGGKGVNAERAFLHLTPLAEVDDATIKQWNDKLAQDRSSPHTAVRKRVERGQSRLMGVKLTPSSGFVLTDQGLIGPGDLPEPPAGGVKRPRVLCEVSVTKDGALQLREVKATTDASPWELTGGPTIHPFFIIRDKKEVATAAIFEMMTSTPVTQAAKIPTDNGEERQLAATDNKQRNALVRDKLEKGAFLVPKKPIRVSRMHVGVFDGDYVHFEIFAKKNLVDPAVPGRDEELVPVPKTPFHVLFDKEASDDYSPRFVGAILKELNKKDSEGAPRLHLENAALAAAVAHEVVKPSEWREFAKSNAAAFSFVITAHQSEWSKETANILKKATAGERRGWNLSDAEIQKASAEIERLAFVEAMKWSPTEVLYHHHPLRFLEWLMTGLDLDVTYPVPGSRPKEPQATLTLREKSLSLPRESVGTIFHHRVILSALGESQSWTKGVLGLGGAIASTRPDLPVKITRAEVVRIRAVDPCLVLGAVPVGDAAVDLAMPMLVTKELTDGKLLADGARVLAKNRLSFVRYEATCHFNVDAPTKVSVHLDGPGFSLRGPVQVIWTLTSPGTPSPQAVELSAGAQRFDVDLQVPPVGDKPFAGPQNVTFIFDVIAGREADKRISVVCEAQGGDLKSPKRSALELATRTIVAGDGVGEDIAKLQVLLSQIPALDGVPCYRDAGSTEKREIDTDFGGKGAAIVNGAYKVGLAKALWRFCARFARESDFVVEAVDYTDDKGASRGRRTRAELIAPPAEKPPEKSADKKGAAKKAKPFDFPVVTAELVDEIVRRFEPPHVLPKVILEVADDDAAWAKHAKSPQGMSTWTDQSKSALLPSSKDRVFLKVSAPAMAELGGSIEIDLKLDPKSAYVFDGTSTVALAGKEASGKVALMWKPSTFNIDAKTNTVTASISTYTEQGPKKTVLLGAIQLFGVRDLTKLAKDGIDRRDAAMLQTYLATQVVPPSADAIAPSPVAPAASSSATASATGVSAGPPAAVVHYFYEALKDGRVDGKWNELAKKALATSHAADNDYAALFPVAESASKPSAEEVAAGAQPP